MRINKRQYTVKGRRDALLTDEEGVSAETGEENTEDNPNTPETMGPSTGDPEDG